MYRTVWEPEYIRSSLNVTKKGEILIVNGKRKQKYGVGAGLDRSSDIGLVETLGVDERYIFDPKK